MARLGCRRNLRKAGRAVVDPAIQHAKRAGAMPEDDAAGSEGPDGADAPLARDNHSYKILRTDKPT
jgi:hypothetical protein